MSTDPFGSRATLETPLGSREIARLDSIDGAENLPYSIKVILESALRHLDGASVTADYERYADRFWACAGVDHFALKFLFATGANAAATCAGVYGWSPLADTGSAVDLKAPYARGDRESQCDLLRTLYGPRQPTIVTADAIRDENSAQQLRDRLFDLKSRPVTTVRFTSRDTPDLQRMRVITFDDSFDEQTPFPRYGSDGSWVGKTFRVLEVDQSLGPSYHTDVYAEEA